MSTEEYEHDHDHECPNQIVIDQLWSWCQIFEKQFQDQKEKNEEMQRDIDELVRLSGMYEDSE